MPGVTAAFAAAASAQIPLTLRGLSSSLVFATGHDLDGRTLPDWAGLALGGATVAVYMGRSVAGAVAERLDRSRPVARHARRRGRERQPRRRDHLHRNACRDLPALAQRGDVTGPVLILIGRALREAEAVASAPLAPSAERKTAAA